MWSVPEEAIVSSYTLRRLCKNPLHRLTQAVAICRCAGWGCCCCCWHGSAMLLLALHRTPTAAPRLATGALGLHSDGRAARRALDPCSRAGCGLHIGRQAAVMLAAMPRRGLAAAKLARP